MTSSLDRFKVIALYLVVGGKQEEVHGSHGERTGSESSPTADAGKTSEARILAILKGHVGPQRKGSDFASRAAYWLVEASYYLTGVFVGLFVIFLGLVSAGILPAEWIALVLVLIALDFSGLAVGVHELHGQETRSLRGELDVEVTRLASAKNGSEGQSANAQQWLTFLQDRLDSGSSWLQALVAVGGLVPAAAVIQTLPPLQVHATLLTALATGGVAGIVAGWAMFAIRATLKERENLLLLTVLVLGGLLRKDQDIATACLWVTTPQGPA